MSKRPSLKVRGNGKRHRFVAPETKPKANTATVEEFVQRITAALKKEVESIFEVGRILIEAQDQLPHGQWLKMVKEKLSFSPRTAQRRMEIARHPVLSNATFLSHLPPNWTTLYALTDIPDHRLEELINAGEITPETEGRDVELILKRLDEEGGGYKFAALRRSLRQLIQFKNNFPDPRALVAQVTQEEEEEAEQFDWRLLGELGAWITDLHAKCEAYEAREAEREREREAEEEKKRVEWAERMERRRGPRRSRKGFVAQEQTHKRPVDAPQ